MNITTTVYGQSLLDYVAGTYGDPMLLVNYLITSHQDYDNWNSGVTFTLPVLNVAPVVQQQYNSTPVITENTFITSSVYPTDTILDSCINIYGGCTAENLIQLMSDANINSNIDFNQVTSITHDNNPSNLVYYYNKNNLRASTKTVNPTFVGSFGSFNRSDFSNDFF